MPPSLDIPDWWGKESARPIIVHMEKTGWSIVELKQVEQSQDEVCHEEPNELKEAWRTRSAKQFTWVVLLKAHKAAGCIAWVGLGFMTLLTHMRERLFTKEGFVRSWWKGDSKPGGRFLRILRILLVASLCLLVFEIFLHSNGLGHEISTTDISLPRLPSMSLFHESLHWLYISWKSFRASYLAPVVQWLADSCIYLFLVQSADRLVLCLGAGWIKFTGYKPKLKEPFNEEMDPENPYESYPMVLVQIPMCNEREVYDQSIGAVCHLDWPKERLLIQVLDDSDDVEIQDLIKAEVEMWHQRGKPILYVHRLIRTGYKAGNMHSAMSHDYVRDYEFVTIFDADFQPRPDFLKRTVPHFKGQPDLGLVQARWAFVNRDENLLTRLQNVNLAFHFEVEQQVNGAFINFFGFNGTAGVWRIKALEDSGGWLDRTTVEDMDIAVRAHLKGWKMIFLNDVEALCELPESYEAYRKQQHRWHSGPMQLFKLALPDIISAKISWWKKFNMIFLFFLLRKMILPFYSFTLFCIVLPLTMFVPEASLPLWVVCYVPATMSLMNVLPSPRSFPFLVPYLLFENCMSVTKFNAMVVGLFQLGSSYEWVVTKKSGRASEADLLAALNKTSVEEPKVALHRAGASESGLAALEKASDARVVEAEKQAEAKAKKSNRKIYRKELSLACLLLVAAARSLLSEHGVHFYFLLFQGLAFLVMGLDLVSDRQ